jgi:hypothetical protein
MYTFPFQHKHPCAGETGSSVGVGVGNKGATAIGTTLSAREGPSDGVRYAGRAHASLSLTNTHGAR